MNAITSLHVKDMIVFFQYISSIEVGLLGIYKDLWMARRQVVIVSTHHRGIKHHSLLSLVLQIFTKQNP